jgi:hypothetical protein
MKTAHFKRILLLVVILASGIWLLGKPEQPKVESLQRTQALAALAPSVAGGNSVVGSAEGSGLTTLDPVYPVPIDFSTVVPDATPNGDSMYERWLSGDLDLAENDGLISADEKARLQTESLQMGPTPGVQIAESGPELRAPSVGVGFESMDYNDGGGSVPPDPELAAGPNHLIAVVNVAFAIYDKSGTALIGPVSAESYFTVSPCTSGLYDPNVLYDEESDRWIIAYDQGGQTSTGGYCLLASQTADPTGLWNQYFFPFNDATAWLDNPHAGVGDNFIFVGGNYFAMPPSSGFIESKIHAFNKTNLYAGNPVTAITLGLGSSIDTPQPLNLHGFGDGTWPALGNTHYFLGEPYDGANYTVLEWNTTTLTSHGNINLGAAGLPVDVPQNGGADLQANDFRPQDFEYRNGYGWTTNTIACNPGGGTVNCFRWAQIDFTTTPPTLGPAGSGTYGSDGDYRFFADLAVNKCNDMAIGYTKSNGSMWPSVWATGRESGDAAGILQAEVQLKAGELAYDAFDVPAIYTEHRWGDYTGMTIDPDGETFWYLGEYSETTGNPDGRWGNYIASMSFPDCSAPDYTLDVTPNTQDICVSSDATYSVDITGLNSFTDPVALSAIGNPGSAAFSANPVTPTGSSTLTISGAAVGSHTFDVQGVGGTPSITKSETIQLNVLTSTAAPTLQSPIDGATGVSTESTLSWSEVGATSYLVEVDDDAGFGSIDYSNTVVSTSDTVSDLAANTTYYWRVSAVNLCGDATSTTFSFTTAAGSLSCNGITVDFSSGIPTDWSVLDNAGNGVAWTNLAGCGESGNFTNGSGDVACVSSSVFGFADFDTEMRTNTLDLTGQSIITLNYTANYQNFASFDFLDVDISTNGGTIWTNLLSWNEDHGGLHTTPGEDVTLDLSSYAGQVVMLRWRYYDPTSNDWDWYAQVDDVALTCTALPPVIGVNPASISHTQDANQSTSHSLSIDNSGFSDLIWSINEVDTSTPSNAPRLMPEPRSDRPPSSNPDKAAQATFGDDLQKTSVYPTVPSALLWDQTANTSTSGALAIYDLDGPATWAVQAADDFVVPIGEVWTIDTIFVDGFYANLVNPASTTNVFVYTDNAGIPDNVIYSEVFAAPTNDISGALTFNLTSPPQLSSGTYWVSVQPEMDYFADGQWYWFNETVQTGAEFVWRNPGDGYGEGCTTWTVGSSCSFTEPDLAFQLLGTSQVDNCQVISDIPWLTTTPSSGTTSANSSSNVNVTFDSTGYASGTYTGILCFSSNDPVTPQIELPVTMIVAPTAVELVRFDAQHDGNGIVSLNWETAIEIDNAGFNVYRSPVDSLTNPNAAVVQVNESLLPAQGSLGQGASYSLTDKVVVGGVWYYFLEDVDFNGVATQHGPIAVETATPTDTSLTRLSGANGSGLLPLTVTVLLAGMFIVLMATRRKSARSKIS